MLGLSFGLAMEWTGFWNDGCSFLSLLALIFLVTFALVS